jgi:D-alanyl-D-alanine carboxypeptidase/D-alanyl-D-alanine-endopeptidase (penicillin-binding protein 4)
MNLLTHRSHGARRSSWLTFGLAGLAWLAALGSAASLSRAQDRLEEQVKQWLAQEYLQTAHIGWLFVDQESGEVVLQRDSGKLFVPASTTKLFSVAAALDALGADYRFRTPVVRRGTLHDDGTLEGDLILVASGDLTLGGRTTTDGQIAWRDVDHTYANWSGDAELTDEDPLAGLNELARQVAAAGIRTIRGEVLIDDRLFEPALGSGSGPQRVTPILVNDNVLDVTLAPSQPSQPALVRWRPQTGWIEVQADVQTVEAGGPLETVLRWEGVRKLVIRGKLPAGHRPLVRIAEVPEPTLFARALFVEALQRHGVVATASLADAPSPARLPSRDEVARLPRVAELVSPPFSENARLILKVSHNLHASTLPLLLAAQRGERTLADGLRLQRDFLLRAGVTTADTLSFGGGAGGARADHVTPQATVELLRAMANRPDFPVFHQALPVLGIDGTLSKAIAPDSPARGKVQAKTGTLTWENLLWGRTLCTSKALAGYMTTARGRRLAFAAFINGVHLKDGIDTARLGRDLGRLCELVHLER